MQALPKTLSSPEDEAPQTGAYCLVQAMGQHSPLFTKVKSSLGRRQLCDSRVQALPKTWRAPVDDLAQTGSYCIVHISGHFLASVTASGAGAEVGAGASSRRTREAKGAAETDTLERRMTARVKATVDLINMLEMLDYLYGLVRWCVCLVE